MGFITLGSIASIKGGKRLPAGVSLSKEENDHPYIRIRDLNNVRMLEKTEDFEYVDDETQKNIARYIVDKGDIVISIVGTIGLISIVGDSLHHANLTENCVRLTDFSKDYDSLFLYYYLISGICQDEIKKSTVGAVQPKLPLKNIAMIPVPKIDLQTQKRIASLLSSLDDKIEVNNQINRNLEEQAKAIFKSWFVDFEPFKDGKFVDSELGQIPEGWRIGVLGNILKQIRKPVSPQNNQHPYLPIDAIPMKSLGIESLRPPEEAQSSLISFSKDDIIIGAMRVYFHRVVLAPCDGITRTTCFVLRPVESLFREYALLLCNLDSSIDYAQNTSKGSTMPYAVWDNAFANMPIIIPPNSVVATFSNKASSLINRIRDSYQENQRLIQLRDTLLPKLMSNEITLS